MNTTLPTGSEARKAVPIVSGCLDYFPAALAGVARVSHAGNQKHNPGEPLHHARGKSTDHADCIVRHLIDLQGLLAAYDRGAYHSEDAGDRVFEGDAVLAEASCLAWRALALSQELHERFGAPLAPGARLPTYDPLPDSATLWARGEKMACQESAPAALQLEVGKRYVQRDGEVTGILRSANNTVFTFGDHTHLWRADGRWSGHEEVHDKDIVAEFSEPKPLQLGAGKRYVRRDGVVTGILTETSFGEFKFKDRNDSWRVDGSWSGMKGEVATRDIVAEFSEPKRL